MLAALASCSVAVAQYSGPSGGGSVTGDPASSSANPRATPEGTSGDQIVRTQVEAERPLQAAGTIMAIRAEMNARQRYVGEAFSRKTDHTESQAVGIEDGHGNLANPRTQIAGSRSSG
jgi:hypothetical protein